MIYATSDLHGWSLDSFLRLLETAGFGDSDCLYVLGDVVDRNGDGGVAMLRWMMGRPNVQLIRGNHEDMLLTCVPWLDRVSEDGVRNLSPEQMQHLLRWLRNGAGPTIRSLQLLKRDLPDTFTRLVDYVKRAPLYASLTAGGRRFVLVHSGFGHTPVGYLFGEAGKMFRTDTWIDIDTGAAGGGAPMLLRLDDLQPFYGSGIGSGD